MPSPLRNKRWIARAKRGGTIYNLGYFTTYDEALAAELAFARVYPPANKKPRKDRSQPSVKKPYQARRYRGGITYQLGHYATYEEARAVEAAFDAEHPRKKQWTRRKAVR